MCEGNNHYELPASDRATFEALVADVETAELARLAPPGAELVAEHTGVRTFLIADDIAECLHDSGVDTLTSGQRALIASVLARYGI